MKRFPGYDLAGYLSDIQCMNRTYHRPTLPSPGINEEGRVVKFKAILLQEVAELDTIPKPKISTLLTPLLTSDPPTIPPLYFDPQENIEYLVELADFCADMIVYCASECIQHGISLSPILFAVMQSNMSKLGADGKPIIDPVTNKFLKGPNFQPPEPRIREILLEFINNSQQKKTT